MKSIGQWVARWRRQSSDGLDELASLILAARDDPAFREQLVFILKLPRTQRQPLIHTAVEEMRLRGEPTAACAAFSALANDTNAQAALRLLNAR